MENKCVPIKTLKPELQSWFTKVLLSEKTPIRHTRWGRQQRLVFMDSEMDTIQAMIYEQDVDQFDQLLHLHHTYYVGNAKVRVLAENAPVLASSGYQITLNKSTFIKSVPPINELPITDIYQVTPFGSLSEFADVQHKQINLLCGVVHVFPHRTIEKTKKTLQEFVVLNEEKRPMILTLWEDFVHSEALQLTNSVHNMPIILAMRLSVNTFHGLSISTAPNSTIQFEPPLLYTQQLRQWLNNNRDYIEIIVSQKLFGKNIPSTDLPTDAQIRKISQILSLKEMVKSFWIKAELKCTKTEHHLYIFACPDCSKPCGASYGDDFTCLYCNQDFKSPKPLLRFQVELFDGSGMLIASIEHKEAELLLEMSGEAILLAETEGEDFSSQNINRRFEGQWFLFQIRTSKTETRGKKNIRYSVIRCLHTSSPSLSRTSTQKDINRDMVMLDPQESFSKIPRDKKTATPAEQQGSSSGKRASESEEILLFESAKHMKSD